MPTRVHETIKFRALVSCDLLTKKAFQIRSTTRKNQCLIPQRNKLTICMKISIQIPNFEIHLPRKKKIN